MTVGTTRGDRVIWKQSYQTDKHPTKPKSQTKKGQMHTVESRELPRILLTQTLCSGQIMIRPGLGLCKSMFLDLSPAIWPTRFGWWKVHCRQKVLHITAGPNSNRHNLTKPPAAYCLLNKNERHSIRRTICIWALPAEAALAGISVLTQPTPALFLFFT